MKFGTTYSHREIEYLKLDNEEAFQKLLEMNFNTIRLCTYWSEIQKIGRDTFDFSLIEYFLDICEKNNQDVVITIGIKSPRYPEFYYPSWTQHYTMTENHKYLFKYIEKSIQTYSKYSCIKYWQVENEPLDYFGNKRKNKTVDYSVLKEEVELVRTLDKRPIVLTVWGNDIKQSKILPILSGLADIVGIDLYYKIPFPLPIINNFYHGPRTLQPTLKKIINTSHKPVWITELQAEPWEKTNELKYSPNPKSFNIEILQKELENVKNLNTEIIFLWGYEYWLWQSKNENSNNLRSIEKLIR